MTGEPRFLGEIETFQVQGDGFDLSGVEGIVLIPKGAIVLSPCRYGMELGPAVVDAHQVYEAGEGVDKGEHFVPLDQARQAVAAAYGGEAQIVTAIGLLGKVLRLGTILGDRSRDGDEARQEASAIQEVLETAVRDACAKTAAEIWVCEGCGWSGIGPGFQVESPGEIAVKCPACAGELRAEVVR